MAARRPREGSRKSGGDRRSLRLPSSFTADSGLISSGVARCGAHGLSGKAILAAGFFSLNSLKLPRADLVFQISPSEPLGGCGLGAVGRCHVCSPMRYFTPRVSKFPDCSPQICVWDRNEVVEVASVGIFGAAWFNTIVAMMMKSMQVMLLSLAATASISSFSTDLVDVEVVYRCLFEAHLVVAGRHLRLVDWLGVAGLRSTGTHGADFCIHKGIFLLSFQLILVDLVESAHIMDSTVLVGRDCHGADEDFSVHILLCSSVSLLSMEGQDSELMDRCPYIMYSAHIQLFVSLDMLVSWLTAIGDGLRLYDYLMGLAARVKRWADCPVATHLVLGPTGQGKKGITAWEVGLTARWVSLATHSPRWGLTAREDCLANLQMARLPPISNMAALQSRIPRSLRTSSRAATWVMKFQSP